MRGTQKLRKKFRKTNTLELCVRVDNQLFLEVFYGWGRGKLFPVSATQILNTQQGHDFKEILVYDSTSLVAK